MLKRHLAPVVTADWPLVLLTRVFVDDFQVPWTENPCTRQPVEGVGERHSGRPALVCQPVHFRDCIPAVGP